jgi:ADP-heptose:LPS heptosyltransferase
VVHPGAAVPARGIPLDRVGGIVAALAMAGWHVALTGSSNERAVTSAAASGHGERVVDLAGRHDLSELAGVLSAADAVVVGNTGPAHLAAAVGTPVVSVFAPVVAPERWKPWGVPVAVLGDATVPCAGCRARRCPLPEQVCLRRVTPDAVVGAVARLVTPAVPAGCP